MINNLNLNSNMVNLTAQNSAEGDLLKLLGKTPENQLDQDILSLLEKSKDSEEASFDQVLNKESSSSDHSIEKLLNELTKLNDADTSHSLELNKKNINNLLSKLNVLIGESEENIDKLVKLSQSKPEIQKRLLELIKVNSESLKEVKNLKKVTHLIIKDTLTPFNSNTVNEKIENKLAINKLLGLSAKEIVDNRDSQKHIIPNHEKKNSAFRKEIKGNKQLRNINPYSKIVPEKMIQMPLEKKSSNEIKIELEKNTSKNVLALNSQSQDSSLENDLSFSNEVKLEVVPTKINKNNHVSKVFNVDQLLVNNDNVDTVISKIQDYIIQSKFAKEKNVQMTFNHSDLGNVDLQVSKLGRDNLGVNIAANNSEAIKFFTENKAELLQTLSNSGISVSEFKLETQNSSSPKDFNSSNQSFTDSKGEFSGSKQGQQDKESRKRQELWELLDKEIA